MNAQVERLAALYDTSPVEQLRIPPQSVQSEQSVLGAFMIPGASESLWPKLSDWLDAKDFYRADHRAIFAAIRHLCEHDQPCDYVTVGEWIEAQGQSELIAGGAYLIELATGTPSAANAIAYAEIVADKAKLRRLIEVGTGMANAGFQPDGRDSRELIFAAQQAITELAGNPRVGGVKSMKDVGRRWYDELHKRYYDGPKLRGLPTPWAKLNALTSGLQAGNLVVLAARPSMGKSAAATNIATANALHGKRVLFFNLEMTDTSIYNRAIAAIGDIPLLWLRDPSKTDADYFPRVTPAIRDLNGSGLLIDDTPGLTHRQIIARAKREHMRGELGMVIIDHLHLIPLPGKTRETVEIGEITRDLKGLAKELNCPVLLLSQLNRAIESRPNKRPTMADLRESGNIEQDADLILFLYRDDYYAVRDDRQSEYPGFVEIIVGKQREGETGKVWTRDRLAYGRIDDYEGEAPKPVSVPTRNLRGMRSSEFRAGADA